MLTTVAVSPPLSVRTTEPSTLLHETSASADVTVRPSSTRRDRSPRPVDGG
jgi:hypothetical protein